ncbi:MAG: DUF4422 domain-containing protein [Synergistaceae bacterium]|nr:DUF4422 domain-containing protein [Synergistaceae bacterium]
MKVFRAAAMSKPDIKIFVSRRIDVDSVAVDNSIYVPVRCGAVYDEKTDSPYLGDDTGDNVSKKRSCFCEFTVQYWAWKNVEADYYGLCHYRRYFSFSEKKFKTGAHGLVMQTFLDENSIQRFKLADEEAMRREISHVDLILPIGFSVEKMFVPTGKALNVRELWDAHDGVFFDKKVIDRMFELIDELSPAYSDSAREYFASGKHIGYNCYVMRRELFERMCRFQFPIIEAIERELTGTETLEKFPRTPAYIGEMLFGVFVYHATKKENCKFRELQLVLFEETLPARNKTERLRKHFAHVINEIMWRSTLRIFPLGTRRRAKVKKVYFLIKNVIRGS